MNHPALESVYIFTDGACRGNPGPGGWGALLRYQGKEKKLQGAEQHTTNNRMELLAVIQALSALKKPCRVEITTDSQYVKKGITQWIIQWQRNQWRTSQKQPVKNKDLWEALLNVSKIHEIQWHWIRGHTGHPENTLVDALAREAIDALRRENISIR